MLSGQAWLILTWSTVSGSKPLISYQTFLSIGVFAAVSQESEMKWVNSSYWMMDFSFCSQIKMIAWGEEAAE